MSLNELNLLHQYRSNKSNLVDEFYIPCLSNSVYYQRAVGYFNSYSLSLAAQGLSHFINNHGKMELIASPELKPEDIEAIKYGYEARENVITRALLRNIPATDDPIVNNRLGFLAWLIANNRLDIKLAIVDDDENGIYHEKIGLFYDDYGNVVAFTGSSNETKGGLYSNFELIEVYCSWREGDQIRVKNKVKDFEELWKNKTENVKIMDFPDVVKEKLLEKRVYYKIGLNDPKSVVCEPPSIQYQYNQHPKIPQFIEIREYQKEAVMNWFRNNGKGIFAMATGTGKTITALTTAVKLYEKTGTLGLIVLCPYIELVDQWVEEAKNFGMFPIIAYQSKKLWESLLNNEITSFNMGLKDHFCVIMTNATFLTKTMQETLLKINRPAMIIADEVHHLGSKKLSLKLPHNITYRLGLSATPKRWFDEEGSDALFDYFNPGIIYEFGLKEAISNGYLTPYKYYPHIVHLSDEEFGYYYEISKKINQIVKVKGEIDLEESRLQHLLIERARILSRAINKIDKLKFLMENERESKFNIFYCGDSKIGDERQIEVVTKLLGVNLGMKVHPFTSNEDKNTRKELLNKFTHGDLQGLVAIRCLDEGVDIPATKTAYILASSTNPKEFIQRRGRVLRKYPGKKYSIIHDFIVIPRELSDINNIDSEIFNIERKLVKRELLRVIEFAKLADNGPQALFSLLELRKVYNLLDI